MAMPAWLAASITSASRIEPPGWMTAVAPAAMAASSPSANGKNASRGDHAALGEGLVEAGGLGGFGAFPGGDAGAVHAAHLAGADAHGGAALGIDDGVGFHVLADAEGEQQVGQFGRRWARVGHHLQIGAGDPAGVARLGQEAAGDAADGQAGLRPGRAPPPVSSRRRFLLARQDLRGRRRWRPAPR
jgi:hypothetical protein